MSFYLNVAHTVLENKKFIPQNKNMARRKSCMSCASFEFFVSGLFSPALYKRRNLACSSSKDSDVEKYDTVHPREFTSTSSFQFRKC